ncbi:MAG: DoxX family protein [Bacteroidales bacterium]|jgi:putative oxidoreductase|nr:DoxX family protein [Bacteroidales bacterium]
MSIPFLLIPEEPKTFMAKLKSKLDFKPKLDWLVFVRVCIGGLIASHSYTLFNADTMNQTAQLFGNMNIPMPLLMAYVSKSVEFFGGICLALGLLTRLTSLTLAFNMLVALGTAFHFNIFAGGEVPFLYLLLFTTFVFVGGGKFSLDKLLMK